MFHKYEIICFYKYYFIFLTALARAWYWSSELYTWLERRRNSLPWIHLTGISKPIKCSLFCSWKASLSVHPHVVMTPQTLSGSGMSNIDPANPLALFRGKCVDTTSMSESGGLGRQSSSMRAAARVTMTMMMMMMMMMMISKCENFASAQGSALTCH